MTGELIVNHELNGVIVAQRPADKYVDATALCRAGGKKWAQFWRLDTTQAFVVSLARKVGIPTFEVAEVRPGRRGGTWVHPYLAVNLAQWLSADFAVQVSEWVYGAVTDGTSNAVAALRAEFEARFASLVVQSRPVNILSDGPAWTIELRLLQLHPDWRTNRKQRARIRRLAKNLVILQASRKEIGTLDSALAFCGDQIQHLDRAIDIVHREAVADGKKDDWGLLRDVIVTPSAN